MSEEITETPRPPNRQERIEAAAIAAGIDIEETPAAEAPAVEAPAADAPAALTKEDVAGKTDDKPPVSDKKLVAPSIREFLRARKEPAAPTGLEREINDLRTALDGLAAPETGAELSFEQRALAKLEALEARFNATDKANAEAREEEEYNNRVRSFREGVIENINADKEKFPGLIALEQQETVFNALVQRENEGIETSEEEIASEVETGLKTVYETLHKVYGSNPSEDPTTASDPKLTLTPALAGSEEGADVDKMSRQERIDYLWAKSQTS